MKKVTKSSITRKNLYKKQYEKVDRELNKDEVAIFMKESLTQIFLTMLKT
ncbi:hypothetical protein [Clostridioides difficile]|nr:hypothetical protein [Clostridioides difficile]HBF5712998.1 hypothetical protein [Clostridioides difficile]HBH1627621.1 hypothetical protein [Clostridioides difficile]HBH3601381.1 hypothetical protein [Clostridioides difficile]HBH3608331.1 hypothetical protein [Clostridioides difficile]HBH3649193.1 hypothetical protein [Clostridioides difficile]